MGKVSFSEYSIVPGADYTNTGSFIAHNAG